MTEERDDRKVLIAELKQHPGFHAWREWAHEIRDAYFLNLAKHLYAVGVIGAEDLAFKRGYFSALNRMFNQVEFSAAAVERDLKNEGAEDV